MIIYIIRIIKYRTLLIPTLFCLLISSCAPPQAISSHLSAEQIADLTLQAILPPTSTLEISNAESRMATNAPLATFTPFTTLESTPYPTLTPINYRPTSTTLASCVPLIHFSFGTVTRVLEGDTIEVSIDGDLQLVRYIGIDSPATSNVVEPWGPEARDQNESIVGNKFVRLVKDVSDHDRENRLLRYVFIGDRLINYEIVRTGFALAASIPPNTSCDGLFRQAEEQARAEKIGIWTSKVSACEITKDPNYGYTMENPIQIGGKDSNGPYRETIFLQNLRGPSGQKITYKRTSSFYYEGNILDAFEVSQPEFPEPVTLYFDTDRFAPVFAPVGFICAEAIPFMTP